MAYNDTKTETFLDTTHLNRSVAAAISRSKIRPRLVESSSKSFTAKDREQAKNRLGDSLSRLAFNLLLKKIIKIWFLGSGTPFL